MEAAIIAPHTSNMRLMTKNHLSVLYVEKAFAGRSLDAWNFPPHSVSRTLHKRGDRKSIDNGGWKVECGWNCPILWRHVARDKGTLHYCLALTPIALNPGYLDTKLKWRLSDTCLNSLCPHFRCNYHSYICVVCFYSCCAWRLC